MGTSSMNGTSVEEISEIDFDHLKAGMGLSSVSPSLSLSVCLSVCPLTIRTISVGVQAYVYIGSSQPK